ncbi:MAG: RDD family protein, partial [Byssovorax sp.]
MTRREASREPVDTTTEIETPEHVRFRYHVAGPAKRALAYFIDLLARGGVLFVFSLLAVLGGVSADEASKKASMGVILLALFVVEWCYYVFFETIWSGRTPGKR